MANKHMTTFISDLTAGKVGRAQAGRSCLPIPRNLRTLAVKDKKNVITSLTWTVYPMRAMAGLCVLCLYYACYGCTMRVMAGRCELCQYYACYGCTMRNSTKLNRIRRNST